MLTFSSLGKGSTKVTGAGKPLVFFPPTQAGEKNSLTFLAAPAEEEHEGVLSWPGEYDQSGVSVKGIGHTEGQQISYVVDVDDIRVAFLSSPLQDLSDKQLETVGEVDVLVLPADEPKLAQKLVDEFDPRVLIITTVKDASILKALGASATTVSEYKMKGSLPTEGREVVVLGE